MFWGRGACYFGAQKKLRPLRNLLGSLCLLNIAARKGSELSFLARCFALATSA